MGLLERVGRMLGGSATAPRRPQAAYFQGERNLFLAGWKPRLREQQQDVQEAWERSAARAVSAVQNSGFIAGIVEVSSGAVVGKGLRMAARPDVDALGWEQEFSTKWARKAESRFRAWAEKPVLCDASAELTFGQMQQAAYASYLAFGEVFALLPLIAREIGRSATKVKLLPPSRLVNVTDELTGVIQGVKVDEWGAHLAYRMRRKDRLTGWKEVDIQARDADGRPNVLLIKDPALATTRGISPLATVLKVVRQVDQYADATLTAALIQTIFAATVKSNISGQAAFDGLITQGDNGPNIGLYASQKGEWYDGANIDLTQHGRIAHMFPGDELEFTEAKTPGQQYDHFMGWLLREIARGAGVTYESATGDYRGATYSSVRMAGAVEWQTVLRRRSNIVVPFCDVIYEWWLDEEIRTGRLEYPGGYGKFAEQRDFAAQAAWTGPARPQADDFKTARAYEVRKDMQATTLAEIAEEYGRDWDDDARQRAAENALHEELGLPLPWAPKDMIETPEGQEAALNDPGNDGSGEKKDPKRPDPKKSGGRDGDGRDPDAVNDDVDIDASIEDED